MFYKQNLYGGCYHQMKNKELCWIFLSPSIKCTTRGLWCASMVTLDFILHKELVVFSEILKNNHLLHFHFLALRKLVWHLAKNECFVTYGIYCWYQGVFIFFTGWCRSCQESSVCSLPLWVMKLKIRINVTELLFQRCTYCICFWIVIARDSQKKSRLAQ